MENLLRHPAFQIIVNSVKKEIRQVFILASTSFSGSLSLAIVSWQFGFVFAVFSLILLLCSVWLFRQYYRLKDDNKNPIIKLMRKNRNRIVWVYPFITEVNPFGIVLFKRCYIIMKLTGGEELSFTIRLKEKKLLLNWMKRILPHAKFGFSKERETRYGSGPESFLDNNWGRN